MKKKLLLLIPALVFSINPIANTTFANSDIELNEDVTTALKTSLSSALELTNNITFHYESYLPSLTIIDEVSTSNRTNIIYVENEKLQESYLSKDKNGYAIESYLSVSNTVETRELVDDSDNNVVFSTTFGSPFEKLTKLTNAQINSYFTIYQNNGNFELSANELAYGTLSTSLLNFYTDYDEHLWDTTVTRSISNLRLTINSNGLPLNLTYDKVKKDIFGGIKETNSINIKNIDSVRTLTPVNTSLTNEQKNIFDTNMSNFQTKLNNGNFTQHISLGPKGATDTINYSNYYELNNDSNSSTSEAMICSMGVEEATYGETYVGIFKVGDTFSTCGISPDSEYSSIISDTKTNDISKVVPRLNDISSSYFVYNEETNLYTFDFKDFIYADTYFCGTILISLFGIVDPCVHNLGLYIYDGYSYYFDSLTIGFDDNGYPYGTLSYHYYNINIHSQFSFSDIGTTILSEKNDIKKVIDYLLS